MSPCAARNRRDQEDILSLSFVFAGKESRNLARLPRVMFTTASSCVNSGRRSVNTRAVWPHLVDGERETTSQLLLDTSAAPTVFSLTGQTNTAVLSPWSINTTLTKAERSPFVLISCYFVLLVFNKKSVTCFFSSKYAKDQYLRHDIHTLFSVMLKLARF